MHAMQSTRETHMLLIAKTEENRTKTFKRQKMASKNQKCLRKGQVMKYTVPSGLVTVYQGAMRETLQELPYEISSFKTMPASLMVGQVAEPSIRASGEGTSAGESMSAAEDGGEHN